MKGWLIFTIFTILAAPVWAQDARIDIAAVQGFNLRITDRPEVHTVVVKPDPPIHNWFAGKFINLPVGVPVEIRVDMNGCDSPGNVADTGKWEGLRPVYSYADPEKYASYEWFRRDDRGQWVSGDLFKQGAARAAGNGKTPAQSAVPAELAERFLGEAGTFWSPWGEIEGSRHDTATRTLTITITPASPVMTIAMHTPYLLSYEQQMIARLKAAHFPGVFVDLLGESAGGRPLYMIRVDDPADPALLQITPVVKPTLYPRKLKEKPCLLTDARPEVHLTLKPGQAWGERRLQFLDAREHASEQIGSWVVFGALTALLADTPQAARLRKHNTWLLLPTFDPDGVAAAEFESTHRRVYAGSKRWPLDFNAGRPGV